MYTDMCFAAGMEEYEETEHLFHWSILSASSLFNASASVVFSFQASGFSLPTGFHKPFP